ncbi:MAG: sensor histidine kinase [Crocinitomicaceae bacterium]
MSKNIISPIKSWWAFLLINFGMGVVITLLFFDFSSSIERIAISIVWSSAISISQWLGHSYIQGRINAKYNWLKFPVQRFFWTVISVVVYSVIAYAVVQSIMNWLVVGRTPIETITQDVGSWHLPIYISFLISLVTGAIGFFTNWKKSELKQEQLKTEMLNYKYESLKNQINPHFMFNSLNVLSELVHEDQNLAVKFIQHFSDMYRYVLESKDHELRSLKEELEFIDKYIFLLKIRFEDKLSVDINIPTSDTDLIVPVALQLIIENAVKHNEVSAQFPLNIEVYKEVDWVIVKNKIQLKTTKEPSNKIGLKNLEQQYSFFNKQIEIETNDSDFIVKIPILNAEEK